MRQWRVSTWNGIQLTILVREGNCLFEAINNTDKGAYDAEIIKAEEITRPEDNPDGVVPPR